MAYCYLTELRCHTFTGSQATWYAFASFFFFVIVMWCGVCMAQMLQLGVLVLDGAGGDHWSSSQPFGTRRCYLHLVIILLASTFGVSEKHRTLPPPPKKKRDQMTNFTNEL